MAVTGDSSSDKRRAYTTKHGTPSTMDTTNIGRSRQEATESEPSRH